MFRLLFFISSYLSYRMKKNLLLPILLFALNAAHAEDLRGDTIDIRSCQLRIDLSDFTNKILKGDALLGIKAKKNEIGRAHV